MPQGDPFGGWISFPAFATDRIGQIRVTRGGGSGYYGPGALAGTVELESLRPAEAAPAVGEVAYGSRNSVDARASLASESTERFATLSGAFASGDGFIPITPATRGPIDRPAPYRQASAAARLVQQLGFAEAQFSVDGFYDQRDRGVPFTRNCAEGIDGSIRLVGDDKRWSVLAYAQFRDFASRFSSVNAARTTSILVLDQYSVPSRGPGFRAEFVPVRDQFDMRIGIDGRFVRGQTHEDYQFVAGDPTRRRTAGGRSGTMGAFAVAFQCVECSVLVPSEPRWGHSDSLTCLDHDRLSANATPLTRVIPSPRQLGWSKMK